MATTGPELDRTVPALLVKVGSYPQHHGGLGVLRTLGRAGVPAYAMVEHPCTPAALSRYCARAFVRPSSGLERPAELLAGLLEIAAAIGRPAVAVPTDDEAAVLLAEHAPRLTPHFLLPAVPPGLPRRLADKQDLHRICQEHGVPTPRSAAPVDLGELLALGREWGYPLVLKNLAPFSRLRAPVVGHTTLVRDEAQLRAAVAGAERRGGPISVLAQEYLPPEWSQDWITHLYCGAGGEPLAVFTGGKLRSWPPGAGVTTRAWAVPNRELAELAAGLCRAIGYAGVADLDWRRDLRDGRYKLVDFNPRTGAQFRLSEDAAGLDVVRALHLDLTGRAVPAADQRLPRGYALGQLDLPSAIVAAWQRRRLPPALLPRRSTERAWLSADDPVPAVAEALWFGGTVWQRLGSLLTYHQV